MLAPLSAIRPATAANAEAFSGVPRTVTWERPSRRARLSPDPRSTSTVMPRSAAVCSTASRSRFQSRGADHQHAEDQPATQHDLLDVEHLDPGPGQRLEDRRRHAGAVLAGQGDQQGPRGVVGRRRWSSRSEAMRCCRWPSPSVRAMTDITPHDQLHRAGRRRPRGHARRSTRARSAGSSTTTAPTTPASARPGGEGEVGGLNAGSAPSRGGPLVLIHSHDLEATARRRDGGRRRDRGGHRAYPGGRRFTFLDPSGNELGVFQDDCEPGQPGGQASGEQAATRPATRRLVEGAQRGPPGLDLVRRHGRPVVEQREIDDRGGPQRPGRPATRRGPGSPAAALPAWGGAGPSARRRPRAATAPRPGRPARPRSW